MAATLVLFAGCAEEERTKPEITPNLPDLTDASGVSGRVLFRGERPRSRTMRMGADAACASRHTEPVAHEPVRGLSPGVAEAFVYVTSGLEDYVWAAPDVPVTLDQKGCLYEPNVFGIRVYQDLRVRNSDPLFHNVRVEPERSRGWNVGQKAGAPDFTGWFGTPEVMVTLRCDVHPWMKAHAGVVAHPYFAVTDEEGAFALPPLPPGTYRLEAWHAHLGTVDRDVEVWARAEVAADLEFPVR